ncbi:MAG: Type 1 glutamine amidotransferase-like domain-containing protein [Actinomycetes bacterium]|jgi:cyanophycinase-like exopeptidase
MQTRRIIELLSSGDFEPSAAEPDRAALELARGDGRVLVVPTAVAPEGAQAVARIGRDAVHHFGALGVTARLLPLLSRDDAFRPNLVADIAGASMIFLAGGQPAYLATTLLDTPFWSAVTAAADRGAAIAGCSAGMWVLGELAPVSTITSLADHTWVPGLRLVPNAVLAAHWEALDSFLPGLQGVVQAAIPQRWTLVAIEERTAAIGDGIDWEVFGRGVVVVARAGHRLTFRRGERFRLPAIGATDR